MKMMSIYVQYVLLLYGDNMQVNKETLHVSIKDKTNNLWFTKNEIKKQIEECLKPFKGDIEFEIIVE